MDYFWISGAISLATIMISCFVAGAQFERRRERRAKTKWTIPNGTVEIKVQRWGGGPGKPRKFGNG